MQRSLCGRGACRRRRPAHQRPALWLLQIGEEVLPVLAEAPEEVAAAYRQPGRRLSDLLRQLVQAGLLGVGSAGRAEHYSARLPWLQPFGQRPAGAVPAPERQPIPLPPKHAPLAAGASRGPAARAAADTVELLLRLPPAWGKTTMSRSNGVKVLAEALQGLLPGAPACRGTAAACGRHVA